MLYQLDFIEICAQTHLHRVGSIFGQGSLDLEIYIDDVIAKMAQCVKRAPFSEIFYSTSKFL